MKNYREISNKYMKENKKRTALTIIGITLATILIFAVGTFLLSFKDSMIRANRAEHDYEFALNIDGSKVNRLISHAEIKDSYMMKTDDELYKWDKNDRGISLTRKSENYFEKTSIDKLSEGSYPEKDNEVIINSITKDIMNVNIGDKVELINENGEKVNFIVVGITETGNYNSNGTLEAISIMAKNSIIDSDKYIVCVNLNSEKHKQDIIEKVCKDIGIEEINDDILDGNSELLYLTGNGEDKGISKSLENMAVFVIVIIIICTITVIYNSFNISVIERIRYFGILKAIGASASQVRNIIYREGIIMGLIAMPLGCFIGYFALKIGVGMFIGNSILMIDNFEVKFYPIVVLITCALVAVTIWFSLLVPARKARRVSAVEAMRNNKEIKIGKIKRRRGTLISKIFGVEGSLAYKNIRRTPARFIITVVALTISIILFNVFFGFMNYAKEFVSQYYGNIIFNSQLSKSEQGATFDNDEIEKICNQSFADDVLKLNDGYYNILNNDKMINKKYINNTNINRISRGITGYIGEEKELDNVAKYIKEGSLDYAKLNDGGVILIDGTKITNDNGKKEIIRNTNYKVGDKIRISRNTFKDLNSIEDVSENTEDYYEVPVVGIAEKEPITGTFLYNEISIMMTDKGYSKIYNKTYNPNWILFRFNNNQEKADEAVKYFEALKSSKGYMYTDMKDSIGQLEDIYFQVEFFVVCFLIIVTIISIVNILNTMSTNLLIRRKEFATLKAIGMEQRQLKKSILLEGTLYGIVASIIGGIVSVLLLKLLINLGMGGADVEFDFAFGPFIISIMAAILMTYIATLIPLNKINRLSIVEEIRDDN